jgi:hypothetical protein
MPDLDLPGLDHARGEVYHDLMLSAMFRRSDGNDSESTGFTESIV